MGEKVLIDGSSLTIRNLESITSGEAKVYFPDDLPALLEASRTRLNDCLREGNTVYGVTTKFGALDKDAVGSSQYEELQSNLLWVLKAGVGRPIPSELVMAGMVVHINGLAKGASGVRFVLLERYAALINGGVSPMVREHGSIGASGDLIPLAAIAGAATGLDDGFKCNVRGQTVACRMALNELGLSSITLEPKEGLSLVNGTSVSTGIAAGNTARFVRSLASVVSVNALLIQAMKGRSDSYSEFVNSMKLHAGQRFGASLLRQLLAGSGFTDGADHRATVVQDRYSIRCIPQYYGPVFDEARSLLLNIENEMNSCSDNPVIAPFSGDVRSGGNFLGQYIGEGMDRMRHLVGMLAKHLDVQLAQISTPEFSQGLPHGLIGNTSREVNMGMKGLQIAANSIMPMLQFYGNSLVDRFPVHAEQYNQNINSLSFGAANLCTQSLELFEKYLSIALLFSIQALDLRSRQIDGHFDPRERLSTESVRLYESVRKVLGKSASTAEPLIWNDNEQVFEDYVDGLSNELGSEGMLSASMSDVSERLWEFLSP